MTEKPKKPRKRRAPAKGGRPEWQPSLDDRTTIERMKFCGESEAVIARALGVDVDTMRKHCPAELKNGHANRRREVIGLLFEAAKAKNVSALRKLEELGRVAGAAEAIGDRSKPRQVAAPRLGKKEERQAAAEHVTGKFTPPEPPKLVVNNQQ